jgi:hypothetical protein
MIAGNCINTNVCGIFDVAAVFSFKQKDYKIIISINGGDNN